jgi:hypothetical protein
VSSDWVICPHWLSPLKVIPSWKGWINGESKGVSIWLMYFLHMYEYETLKLVKIMLRRGKRENNGGSDPNWGTLYACMEMSQQNCCATIIY